MEIRRETSAYTVAVVTPLEVELIAMMSMLDKQHHLAPLRPRTDDNTYTFGELNGHNVVILNLPEWNHDPVSAAHAINPMFNTFTSLRATLLVGVGGGIVRDGHGPSFGDVVIGWNGAHDPAVIAWGFNEPSKRILPQPRRLLQNVLTQFKMKVNLDQINLSKTMARMEEYAEKIKDQTKKEEIIRRFAKPSSNLDPSQIPEQSTLNLPPSPTPSENQDAGGSTSHQKQSNLTLHYGTIVTVPEVIDTSEKRRKIEEETDAICVEMEAAGLVHRTECLSIRGISDLADQSKGDEWKGYAALAAAAVARGILLSMDPSDEIFKIVKDAVLADNMTVALRIPPVTIEPALRLERHYQERPSIDKTIERACVLDNNQMGKGPSDLLLYGLGGSGKTQVALNFFRQRIQSERFYHRLWVNASSEELLKESYRKIHSRADLKGSDHVDDVIHWLEESPQSWLLVLDDLGSEWDGDLNIRRYLPPRGCGFMLMTARVRMKFVKTAVPMSDHQLSIEEAYQLLLNVAPGIDGENVEQKATCKALVQDLRRLPLAIHLAGTYMERCDTRIQTYYEEWKSYLMKEQATDDHGSSTGYGGSIKATFQMTFNRIQQMCARKPIHSIELFNFFTFLHPGSASVQLLHAAWKYGDSHPWVSNTQQARNAPNITWLEVLRSPRPSNWNRTRNSIREGLSLLEDFCFLTVVSESPDSDDRMVSVHPLIHEWRRISLNDKEKKEWYIRTANILAAVQAQYTEESIPTSGIVTQMSHLLLTQIMDVITVPSNFASQWSYEVASLWGDCFHENGYFNDAINLRMKVYKSLESSFQKNERDFNLRRHFIDQIRLVAESYYNLGNYVAARSLRAKAHGIAAETCKYSTKDFDKTRLLECKEELAHSLSHAGHQKEALALRETIWKVRKGKLNEPSISNALLEAGTYWAESLIVVGRHREAIPEISKLVSRLNGSGASQCDRLLINNVKETLAMAYTEEGEHQEALAIRRDISESLPRKDDLTDPESLNAFETLAISCSNLGRSHEKFADECLRLTSRISQHWRSLGSRVPRDLPARTKARYNFAMSVERKGFLSEALKRYKEVMEDGLASVKRKHTVFCEVKHDVITKKLPKPDKEGLEDTDWDILACRVLHQYGEVIDLLTMMESFILAVSKQQVLKLNSGLPLVLMKAWKTKRQVIADKVAGKRLHHGFLNRILQIEDSADTRIALRQVCLQDLKMELEKERNQKRSPHLCDPLLGRAVYDISMSLSDDYKAKGDFPTSKLYLRYVSNIIGPFPQAFPSLIKDAKDRLDRLEEMSRQSGMDALPVR